MLLAVLGACSQNEPGMQSDNKDHVLGGDENFVSLGEACEIAGAHYNAVFGGTRTKHSLSLKGFEVLGKLQTQTRSNDESSSYGYYILNFEDNAGFAIVSADRRRNDLYAISDEGSLHLSDTLENAGLNWYLNSYL